MPNEQNIVRKLKKLCFECKTEYLATLRRPGNRINPTTANTPEPQTAASKKYSLDYDDTEVDLDMSQGASSTRQSADMALAFAPFSQAMSLPAMHSLSMAPAISSGPPSQKVGALPALGHPAQATPANPQPMSASQVLLQQPLSNFILSHSKHASHPSTPAPSTHSTIQLQGSRGISRALVNMTGRLGRWKRVLSPRAAPMPTQLSCRGLPEFDLDINAPGDLLTIQGGVEQYLRLLNLAPLEQQRVVPVEEVHPLQKNGADVDAFRRWPLIPA
jgi:GDP/GTP exchange factor required for growth at low temperature